jgi:hypothetical protein
MFFTICFCLLQLSLCRFCFLFAQSLQLGVITGAPDINLQKTYNIWWARIWGFEGGLSFGYLPKKSRLGLRADLVCGFYNWTGTFLRPPNDPIQLQPVLFGPSVNIFENYRRYNFAAYLTYSFLKPKSKLSLVLALGAGASLYDFYYSNSNYAEIMGYRQGNHNILPAWLYSSALRLGYNANPRYKLAIEICHKWVSEEFIPWTVFLNDNRHYLGLRLVTNFTLGKIK